MDASGSIEGVDSLASAVADSPDGVALLDPDGVVREANASFAAIYGYDDPEAVVGRSWEAIHGGDDVETALSAVADGGTWRGEIHSESADDGESGADDHPGPVLEASLSTTGDRFLCIAREVTQRVRRRDRLEFYEQVLTSAPDPIYTLDREGRITWLNEHVVEKYDVGYDREELIGEYVSKVLGPEDINRSLSVIRDLVADEDRDSGRCEVTIRTAEGEDMPVELHISLLPDPEGGIQGTVGIIREITARKRHEQRLSVLQRVLRHNVRNASTTIVGYANELRKTGDDREREYAERILRAATDLDDLGEKARRIEAEIDEREPTTRRLDVVPVVEAVVADFADDYPGATLTVAGSESAVADTGEAVEMAVDALVENAIEHNDEDPRVEVAVESPADRADGRVAVRVADDGPGIPDHERRILSAETEDPLDHGSGLGLWLVHWFIQEYDGDLSFGESKWGGAAVEVALPAYESSGSG